MSFPEVKFGICQVCGADGGDHDNPSSADASARDTTGSGVLLEEYDGKMMCQLCIKSKKADEEGKIAADRHAEEDRFRAQAGFVNSEE